MRSRLRAVFFLAAISTAATGIAASAVCCGEVQSASSHRFRTRVATGSRWRWHDRGPRGIVRRPPSVKERAVDEFDIDAAILHLPRSHWRSRSACARRLPGRRRGWLQRTSSDCFSLTRVRIADYLRILEINSSRSATVASTMVLSRWCLQ